MDSYLCGKDSHKQFFKITCKLLLWKNNAYLGSTDVAGVNVWRFSTDF